MHTLTAHQAGLPGVDTGGLVMLLCGPGHEQQRLLHRTQYSFYGSIGFCSGSRHGCFWGWCQGRTTSLHPPKVSRVWLEKGG